MSRTILEARDLDEAVSLATMEPQAFPFHHNFVSLAERRIVSVETASYPTHRHDVTELEGLYIHTNHFLHPRMVAGEAQPFDVPYVSSTTRLEVLNRAVETRGQPSDVDGMLDLLSLHEGRPYSPCRHPEGDIHGVTLGTTVFQSPDRRMVLYHGNPCLGRRRAYVV